MLAGHLAVSLGAKSVVPKTSLGVLIAAGFGLDLLWPVLVLTGIEVVQVTPGATAFTQLTFESYPWSHSLLMVLVWSLIVAGLVYSSSKVLRDAVVLGVLVASHWALDFVTHQPDLPLWPGGPEVGLGLWNSIPGTLLLEGGLFLAAILIFSRSSRAKDGTGRWAFWALITLTGAIWITQPWSPPPPSSTVVALTALSLWILPLWGHWIDRHRGTWES